MTTTQPNRRLEIARLLHDAVEKIKPLPDSEWAFDYAVRNYVVQHDNEMSRQLAEYVKALGLGDEAQGGAITEEEGQENHRTRHGTLLALARHFDVPEVTGFVQGILECIHYQKMGIVPVILQQADIVAEKLAALERGEPVVDVIAALGPLALLYADPTIMAIVVDAPGRVSFVRSGTANALADADVTFTSQAELRQTVDTLMALGGGHLSEETPTVEVRLPDGARALAVIPPAAVGSAYLFIEKVDPSKFSFSWEMLLRFGTLSQEAHDLIQYAIGHQGPQPNIFVVGDTRSAKDYLLNLLAESLPPEERVIVVAEAFLLPVERHPRRIHLEPGRTPQTSVRHLLDVATRMGPTWLVTGDLQGPEALTLVQLLNSGYHALTTLCAQSPLDALTQIETMCLMSNPSLGLTEIRPMIAAAFPLIIFMKSHALPDHRIKITQMVEISGIENDRYLLQPLFTYDNEQGALNPTEAGKTWAERARNRIVTG
jgi:pilus assembly protein CpaF